MATDIDHKLRQITAGADLSGDGSKFKAVNFDGTIASENLRAAGILRHGAPTSGFISVVYEGLTKAYLGATVSTPGIPLKITTSGFLIACASGDTAVGRLGDRAGASGDLAEVSVDFKSIGYFRG